ncbi:hypothetical protein GA0070606_4835 [Micromonospora citrea]|uniref:Uncharacterized protein n=1 Tax=Micromonospora citrea TaxID=47855 RepID=A0A1C6VR19_9ACTN|nr:hypothetical protein [Micromonospora citrea]SCL68642.1 hypothetical protein GA0070606_4835 [Micromonospora citrea]
MDYETVGKICLQQNAWVVARVEFVVLHNGEMVHIKCDTGDVRLGQKIVVDPGKQCKMSDGSLMPTGALFSLYVFVVWGNDVQAHEIFKYESGNSRTANYTLTGTTLDSHLQLTGIS